MRRELVAILMFLPGSVLAFGQGQVNGMIIHRWGDTMVVKSPESGQTTTTVVLTSDTKTKDNKGLLGVREESHGPTLY